MRSLRSLRSGFWDGVPRDVCAPYPKLLAVTRRVGHLPSLRAHYGAKDLAAAPTYAVFAQEN